MLSVIAFSGAISACQKGEEWQRALQLLKEMHHEKLRRGHFSLWAPAMLAAGRWYASMLFRLELARLGRCDTLRARMIGMGLWSTLKPSLVVILGHEPIDCFFLFFSSFFSALYLFSSRSLGFVHSVPGSRTSSPSMRPSAPARRAASGSRFCCSWRSSAPRPGGAAKPSPPPRQHKSGKGSKGVRVQKGSENPSGGPKIPSHQHAVVVQKEPLRFHVCWWEGNLSASKCFHSG